MTSISQHGELAPSVSGQAAGDDAVAVAQLRSEIAGGRGKQEDLQGSQSMATAAQASAAATAGVHPQDFNAISSFLARHLQQQQPQPQSQQLVFSTGTPVNELDYSTRSAPAAALGPAGLAALGTGDSDADRTESAYSGAKSIDASASGGGHAAPRRRKTSDAASMEKLQALADVSEERLAKQEKRMMKNRESAARSRLRRQQHTEALEEQNTALKSEVLALRTQMAVLQNRVTELEWQLQVAQAAAGGPAAPLSAPPASAVSPAAAAAIVPGTASLLSSLGAPANQTLGNLQLSSAALGSAVQQAATAAARSVPAAAVSGLPQVPSNRGSANGAPLSPTPAAAGGGGGNNAFIDALAAALARSGQASRGGDFPAAGPTHASSDAVEATGTDSAAMAALLGITSGPGTASEADTFRSSSLLQQLGAANSRASAAVGDVQQQQQQQQGPLPVAPPPAALQQQTHQQQGHRSAPQQSNVFADLNQLLAAALTQVVSTKGQPAPGKPQQSEHLAAAPPATSPPQAMSPLAAVLLALQQVGVNTPAAAPAGSPAESTLAAAAKLTGTVAITATPAAGLAQQEAVQTGVAAIMQAMQAATAGPGSSSSSIGLGDVAAALTAALGPRSTGSDAERPSKRMCS